jgi:fibronectin type 3 domain-containing protein
VNAGSSAALLAAAAMFLTGCGYTGEPLPPALNLPARITDVAAVERGSRLIIQFTLPTLTTEGMTVQDSEARVVVGAFDASRPFDPGRWVREARVLPAQSGGTRYETSATEFYGKTVAIAAKVLNRRGRDAGFSNFVQLQVIPAVPMPQNVHAQATAQGVELLWQGQAPAFRVFRKAPGDKDFAFLAELQVPTFTDDKTAYGKSYRYIVQAVTKVNTGVAESELSPEAEITPVDTFAPAVPSGLSAVIGPRSVELVWNRDTEPDLAGYRIYRAEGTAPLSKLSEGRTTPTFSDRTAEKGKTYRYAVAAFDQAGNESAKSAEVTTTIPN